MHYYKDYDSYKGFQKLMAMLIDEKIDVEVTAMIPTMCKTSLSSSLTIQMVKCAIKIGKDIIDLINNNNLNLCFIRAERANIQHTFETMEKTTDTGYEVNLCSELSMNFENCFSKVFYKNEIINKHFYFKFATKSFSEIVNSTDVCEKDFEKDHIISMLYYSNEEDNHEIMNLMILFLKYEHEFHNDLENRDIIEIINIGQTLIDVLKSQRDEWTSYDIDYYHNLIDVLSHEMIVCDIKNTIYLLISSRKFLCDFRNMKS